MIQSEETLTELSTASCQLNREVEDNITRFFYTKEIGEENTQLSETAV